MSLLVLAGITVLVPDDGLKKDYVTIGDSARAVDGTFTETITGRKRTWQVTTSLMDSTAIDTLVTAITAAPTVTASGTGIGGSSATVWVRNISETPGPTAIYTARLTFTLEEA